MDKWTWSPYTLPAAGIVMFIIKIVTHMCITLDSRNKNLSGIYNSTFLLFDPHHMQMKKTEKVLFLFHKLDKAQRG